MAEWSENSDDNFTNLREVLSPDEKWNKGKEKEKDISKKTIHVREFRPQALQGQLALKEQLRPA